MVTVLPQFIALMTTFSRELDYIGYIVGEVDYTAGLLRKSYLFIMNTFEMSKMNSC